MTLTSADNALDVRIAHVRRYVTIFELLTHMGVDVPEATHQIRCPFHEDRSPSARVYAEQNKIWCFTEQRGWDVVDAAQTYLKTASVADAVRWLEQTFRVPGVAESLQLNIRTQLAARVEPDVQSAAAMVERRLYQAREVLGYERYTRLLLALDLSIWEFHERRVKSDQLTVRLSTILAHIRTATCSHASTSASLTTSPSNAPMAT